MPPVTSSPEKLFIAEFPTPNRKDFYLYERVQTFGAGFTFPLYGEKVPEKYRTEWPDHVLSLIVPDRESGDGWCLFIYSKEPVNQNDDNWELVYPTGSNAFPQVRRTYIYKRADYLASGPLALGTNDPGLKNGDTEAMFPGCILVLPDEQGNATGDKVLQSLYVKVTRTFMEVPDITDSGDLAAAKLFGTRAEYPYGLIAYPRVVWRIPCDSEVPAAPLTSACPIPGYTASTFGDVTPLTSCTTNGTTTVTCASTQFLYPGAVLTGTDMAAGTTVVSITNATTFVITPAATGSSSGLTLTPGYGLKLLSQGYEREKEKIVALTRVYEPVYGPLIPEADLDSYFKPVRTTQQIVAQSAVPATSALLTAELLAAGEGISIEYHPMGTDGLRSVRVVTSPQVPDLSDSGELTQAALFGFSISYPYGVTAYPRVTWRSPCDTTAPATPLTNTCPIAGFTAGTFGDTTPLTGGATNGTTTVTVASTARLYPGALIAGTNIPAGATVVSITSTTAFVISAAATGTASGLTFTVGYYVKLLDQQYEMARGQVVALTRIYEPVYGPLIPESDLDQNTFTAIRTTKQIVAQSAVPATAALLTAEMTAAGDGVSIEYKPMGTDGLRSVRIVSYADVAALDWIEGNSRDIVTYGKADYSWPDTLVGATWYHAYNASGSDIAADVALKLDIAQGYRGSCPARFTERYTSDPTNAAFIAALPAITVFFPRAETVVAIFAAAGGGRAQNSARTFQIPAVLHPYGEITVAYPSSAAQWIYYTPDLAATVPTELPTDGSVYIVKDVQHQRVSSRLWKYTIIEVAYPTV